MSHDKIGPKEQMLRNMRESSATKAKSKRPSVSDVRTKIAKIKPVTRHGGKRGR
jgi:hypothetical protein